jgi:hypothetical protein
MNCKTCQYFKVKVNFAGYTGPNSHHCCRYPTPVAVKPEYGCGEFVKKDGRRKKV